MSLTHPNPFSWRSNPPMPELAGFIQELANKSKNPAAKRAAGKPSEFLPADTNFQPPHFRKPKPVKVARPQTKADKLRELLREHGPLTSIELAALSMLPAKQVPAYLKWDMDAGRIVADRSTVPCRYGLVEVVA